MSASGGERSKVEGETTQTVPDSTNNDQKRTHIS